MLHVLQVRGYFSVRIAKPTVFLGETLPLEKQLIPSTYMYKRTFTYKRLATIYTQTICRNLDM